MTGQKAKTVLQDRQTYLDGSHDFQADIELLAASTLVGTILETVMLATNMRFAGVARVTADRWVACRTIDEVNFGIAAGDEIAIESTFCQTVRDTAEMVIFSDATTDPTYRGHPIASAFGIVSYVSVPIYRGDGSFFGTLCAIDTEPKDVKNPRAVAMFEMFADLIGHSLETEERLEAQELLVKHQSHLVQLQEEFVAILGHDLRNPVAALGAGLRQLGKEPLTDRGRSFASLMRASLHRMNELIDNMMLHAKSRLGGGITVSPQPDAPLADALSQVVDEIRVVAPERDITLDLKLAGPVSCDAARVAQAVSNLISNAVKHGDSDAPIRVFGTCSARAVTIDVENDGKPIPPELQRTLFEPFRRGSDVSEAGLGLGLHIASTIAAAHKGQLSVDCEGRTTRFRLELPMHHGS
ncbi:GAF domain-containing sensor histidine kinase [Poseidonocella sedimentorum]|uniref:histidine kinase n=1 Tax=Poseidonocella sedimentorum TaxID=871652 RepID=A0A1I6CUU5_9RHOB|nr:GAF domain-containing sensor histidine kinase [Poseidonocella sedimentorum]SFQ96989.1 Signal transduction histidine kinase [Poseidonocella sedimentorum]